MEDGASRLFTVDTILVEPGLSFLRLWIMPPARSLGDVIRDGQMHLGQAWWISTLPELIVLPIAVALHFLSDGIRQVLAPRSRK
ncbi:hypothetical protein V8J36_16995 [Frigidibacter sp. MR17.14]|uniref:hypothetical protein n=1 Tax=Frigidibacter sp. MR17.14 TaxID=3126509 RepID=UPI003012C391